MRYAMVMTLAAALAVPAAGCRDRETSTCGRYCKVEVADRADCLADLGCAFVDERTCIQDCVQACDSAMSRIDRDSRAEAEACIDCVYGEVGSSPRCGDVEDAVWSSCWDECGEDGMEHFLDELSRYRGGCEYHCGSGGGYNNVAACQHLEDTINGLPCWHGDPVDFGCSAYEDTTCDMTAYLYCTADCYGCYGDDLIFDLDKFQYECEPLLDECR